MTKTKIIARMRSKEAVNDNGFFLDLYEDDGIYVVLCSKFFTASQVKSIWVEEYKNRKDARRYYYESGMGALHGP